MTTQQSEDRSPLQAAWNAINGTSSGQAQARDEAHKVLAALQRDLKQLDVTTAAGVDVREDRVANLIVSYKSTVRSIQERTKPRAQWARANMDLWSEQASRLRSLLDTPADVVAGHQQVLAGLDDSLLLATARIAAAPQSPDYALLVLVEQEARRRGGKLATEVAKFAATAPSHPMGDGARRLLQSIIQIAEELAEIDVDSIVRQGARGVKFTEEPAEAVA